MYTQSLKWSMDAISESLKASKSVYMRIHSLNRSMNVISEGV